MKLYYPNRTVELTEKDLIVMRLKRRYKTDDDRTWLLVKEPKGYIFRSRDTDKLGFNGHFFYMSSAITDVVLNNPHRVELFINDVQIEVQVNVSLHSK